MPHYNLIEARTTGKPAREQAAAQNAKTKEQYIMKASPILPAHEKLKEVENYVRYKVNQAQPDSPEQEAFIAVLNLLLKV